MHRQCLVQAGWRALRVQSLGGGEVSPGPGEVHEVRPPKYPQQDHTEAVRGAYVLREG